MHGGMAVRLPGVTQRCSWQQELVKDVIGRPLAVVVLVALSPVLAVLCGLVLLSSGRPIFHRRRVVGQGGTTFDALKFRTMVADADDILARDDRMRRAFEERHKLTADPRITRVGRVLRKYSLDELPQLINIVRGEMWLVGPRMISPPELSKYGPHAAKLVSVKPNITGL